VLRGIPGSGKSTVARRIKELEVERGGAAPRIHCIDDYYLTVSVSMGQSGVVSVCQGGDCWSDVALCCVLSDAERVV